ncbi:MAG: DUF4956 domain-containing protein [Oscillospiraceae bacterium]|nr:DUF4956 domain-containing protein [Oscillospiraceae bacterium]
MDTILDTISTVASGDLTFGSAAITMAAALIFGLAISFTYIFTHKNTYQQSLALTLTMLPVILSVIILFVGSNVARAFSLAGTLSIIRFRSAPGDPVDIGYIFFDIAAGLACGVGLYMYGAVFVLVLCLFLILLNKVNFAKPKTQAKHLKVVIPEDLDYQGVFDEILKKYTTSHTLQKVKTTDLGSLYELVYSVTMKKDADEKQFIDDIRCRNGNLSIILSMASNDPYSIK